MLEIIIAIIIQVTTILNGGTDAEKAKAEQKAKTEQSQPANNNGAAAADGGTGTWDE